MPRGGKKTPGVDGVANLTPPERLELVNHLHLEESAAPVRRVYIPKPGTTEQRPLGIPTLAERAKQSWVTQALEPAWEAQFEPNSYGFRPGRSAWDAIGAIYVQINQKPTTLLRRSGFQQQLKASVDMTSDVKSGAQPF
jgi:RNA-directed DNA polymerase